MFQLGGEFVILVHQIADEGEHLVLVQAILYYLKLLLQEVAYVIIACVHDGPILSWLSCVGIVKGLSYCGNEILVLVLTRTLV